MVFFIGALISFLGQLPLGNMAITATQIGVQESIKDAWKYAVGVALIEVTYLRVSLFGVNWIMQHQGVFAILGWVTVAVFLVLGILSFVTASKQKRDQKSIILKNKINRFILGISMSALNPIQIPFWFIWASYLLNTNVLEGNNTEYNIFTGGAGLGTLLGFALYIHGGKMLVTKMNTSNKTLNKIMGVIFIVSALIQGYKMIFTEEA